MHPPLDDPTMPYHATAYLKGHLQSSGFSDISTRDINIEFVDWCLQKSTVEAFHREADRRITVFNAQPQLTLQEQEEFLGLWSSPRCEPGELATAAAALRSTDSFLDYPAYLQHVHLIERYFRFLGALSYPAGIGNIKHFSRGTFSIYNLNDLFNLELAERVSYPVVKFFQEQLSIDTCLIESDVLGISIVYDHQIIYSVWLAHAFKSLWPEKIILLGGTAISQYYKYMKDKSQMKRFFNICDAVVVGEGESAIVEIAKSGGDRQLIADAPNTITYNPSTGQVRLPVNIHYEKVPALGTPVYSFPWELYLSPNRGVNYSPTRGCYWNRCTFCDYGLNTDSPTSPWRERKIDQVIADLKFLTESQKIKFVYFAVDVMAPGYLERLSDAIIDAGLDIRWSAELRMEKIFMPERCVKMAKAGCVCVSFGMESGNQRILDLIDKGTNVQYMAKTMENFSAAGIAVQLMAFHGFPTETEVEKKATFEFVNINQGNWATGGIGTFVLTGTAIVARNPEKFGIKIIETQDLDVTRALAYQDDGGSVHGDFLLEDCDASFNDDLGIFPSVLGRPWTGGTDTLHSMVYYDRYGRKFFKDNPLPALNTTEQSSLPDDPSTFSLEVKGQITSFPFNISRMLANRKARINHKFALIKSHIEPTFKELLRFETEVGVLGRDSEKYWIVGDEKCMQLDASIYRLLKEARNTEKTVKELLEKADADNSMRMRIYLDRLATAGLVSAMPASYSKGNHPLTPDKRFRSQSVAAGD